LERKSCHTDVKYGERVCVVGRCPIIFVSSERPYYDTKLRFTTIMLHHADCTNSSTALKQHVTLFCCLVISIDDSDTSHDGIQAESTSSLLWPISPTRRHCTPATTATYPPLTASSISYTHAPTLYVETLLSGNVYQYVPIGQTMHHFLVHFKKT
jgi:hypothetical protein